MSPIEEFNAKANEDTDREHEMQLELLQKLCLALDSGAMATTVHQILSDLIDYSEAHFMSEELLMRMKSYDDYEEHQGNHSHILEVLRDMAARNIAGEGSLLKQKAHDVTGFITQHIATRDKRLADHVRLGL